MTTTVFTASGTFTPATGVTSVDVLVVGGGGGGGRGNLSTTLGGGGGAGGVKEFLAVAVTPGVPVTVTVGGGGAGATVNNTDGANGSGSAFGASTVSGGGGGGAGASSSGGSNAPGANGASGGGGGCSSNSTGSPFAGGTGISGEGHAGGSGIGSLAPSDARNAGGGGGAGTAGSNGTLGNTTPFTTFMGHGGAGADYSATYGTGFGVSGVVGGGGGGGTSQVPGSGVRPSGGTGGGGIGGTPTLAGGAGTANTGGGGGGSSSSNNGGNGGSGVVVVLFAPPAAPGVPTSVTATPDETDIELSWGAPASGGTVSSYEVRLDGGTPVTATSPHDFTGLTPGTEYDLEVRAVGAGGSSSWVLVTSVTLLGVPTSVTADPDATDIELSWGAPASGGTVSSYEVRLDGGTPVTATSPHDFTGLTPATSYDLEVRAVGPLVSSSWVLVTSSTTVYTPPGYFRVELELGAHTWSILRGDGPAYGPVLPLTLGWDIPDAEFFPAQANLTTLGFAVQCEEAGDLADVVKGTTVLLRMYVSADPLADPWQTFDGVVTQLDGETVPPATQARADAGQLDFRVTVFAGDDNARLADLFVGFLADWPVEHIEERVERICTETGITYEPPPLSGLGMVGWLRDRAAAQPLSTLEALRATLKDAADDYTSEPPDEFYGRYVFFYDHTDETLRVYVFRRRVFPLDGGDPYPGATYTLDGGKVLAEGKWSKQPGPAAASWVIVDGTMFGTPSGVPYVRSTSLFDTTAQPDPINYSATERDNLGESLLPDGSTALDGWSSRSLRYLAHLDPDPVALWASRGWATFVTPVVVTPLGTELEVNGEDYLAGTLTGARLVIPPGGDYFVEIRLRNELLPGTELP